MAEEKYKLLDKPHMVTLSNGPGDSFKAESFGEGWKNGYHVRQTYRSDDTIVEYIDKGSFHGINIGDDITEKLRASDPHKYVTTESAKIVQAQNYHYDSDWYTDKVDYTVEVKDKYSRRPDGRTFSEESLKEIGVNFTESSSRGSGSTSTSGT